MTEDELYRASTQYRLWSFTPESLASFRASTNAIASQRVRAAIRRARQSQRSNGASSDASNDKEMGDVDQNGRDGQDGQETDRSSAGPKDVECLTVEEEQELVGYYCVQAMGLADFCSFPTNVKVGAYRHSDR